MLPGSCLLSARKQTTYLSLDIQWLRGTTPDNFEHAVRCQVTMLSCPLLPIPSEFRFCTPHPVCLAGTKDPSVKSLAVAFSLQRLTTINFFSSFVFTFMRNAPGVPAWILTVVPKLTWARKQCLSNPFVFCCFRTLPFYVSSKAFVCHLLRKLPGYMEIPPILEPGPANGCYAVGGVGVSSYSEVETERVARIYLITDPGHSVVFSPVCVS